MMAPSYLTTWHQAPNAPAARSHMPRQLNMSRHHTAGTHTGRQIGCRASLPCQHRRNAVPCVKIMPCTWHLHKIATLQAAVPQLQMCWGVPQISCRLPQRQGCGGVLGGAVPLPHSCGQIAHGSCVALQRGARR